MVNPGESIQTIVSRFSIDELKDAVGEDICRSLRGVVSPGNLQRSLEKVCCALIEDDCHQYLSDPNKRKLIHTKISNDKFSELLNRLRIGGEKEGIELIGIEDDKELFRQYLGFFGLSSSGFKLPPSSLAKEVVEPEYTLFKHQRDLMWKVHSYVSHGRPVVLHMPTGSGKTRTSMHLVAHYLKEREPGLVLWLASTSELLEQAADTFANAWGKLGNRRCSIYRVWGDKAIDLGEIDDGVVVSGFQKLTSLWKTDPVDVLRLAAKVSLVVVDEAHQAIAPTYKDLIEKFLLTGRRGVLVGLTATPGRTWDDIERDQELADFFSQNKVSLEIDGWDNPVSYLIEKGYLAKPVFKKLDYGSARNADSKKGDGDDFSSSDLDRVASDQDRNIQVIKEVQRLVEVGHKRIIVFCASVYHCKIISHMLRALSIDSGYIHGGTDDEKRKRIIKRFKSQGNTPQVICNFGVLTTGFDAPQTSAAIIARPTRSLVLFSQMVGRAIRGEQAGGNREAEIVTIVDTSLPGFGDVAEAFSNWEDVWKKKGA